MDKVTEFTLEQIEATMTYYGLIYMIDAIKKLRKNDRFNRRQAGSCKKVCRKHQR